MANIGIVSKAKSYVKDFFAHWNVPYEGRYIKKRKEIKKITTKTFKTNKR